MSFRSAVTSRARAAWSGSPGSLLRGPSLRTFTYGVDGLAAHMEYGPAATAAKVDAIYDDSGTRVWKRGSQTVVYAWPHFEVRGGVRHRYVFANGSRVALLTPTATYYFHGDHLGSTRAITNSSGGTVWTGSYEPFGRLSAETGTRVSSYLFTGQELDSETGLYYFGARYYDPSSGMFTSADSILARPFDPQSLNRYAYVGNKPMSRFDPDGHNWWDDFKGAMGQGWHWLRGHSDGGFGPPPVSVNSNGDVNWSYPEVYTSNVFISAYDPMRAPPRMSEPIGGLELVPGSLSGWVVQVTLPNGDTYIPMTTTKAVFAKKMKVPEEIPIPFFYPTSVQRPQEMVSDWRSAGALVRRYPQLGIGAAGVFAVKWMPRGLGDWKLSIRPIGLYDGTANLMYGATGRAFGFPSSVLFGVRDVLGAGGNSPVNNAAILDGYFAADQGWQFTLVPYTWTWP